jgi:hypothetical protein
MRVVEIDIATFRAAMVLLIWRLPARRALTPGLMLLAVPALPAHQSRQFRQLRHFTAHFFLDNFEQRDVRYPQMSGVCHQGMACRSSAGNSTV